MTRGTADEPLAFGPPIEVVRPVAAEQLPAEGPAGAWYEPKLDGYRVTAWRHADRVVLLSREGNDLSAMAPDVTAMLERLPAGVVLDGELCAVIDGHRMEFAALAHRRRRDHDFWPPVVYAVFDILAAPPHRDLRPLPLVERHTLLTRFLAPVEPPVQQLIGTRDRELAQTWPTAMAAAGVEGLLSKPLDRPYLPRSARWVKVRTGDTADALLVGITGPAAAPRQLLIELPEQQRLLTTPRLGRVQAHALGERLAGLLTGPAAHDAQVDEMVQPLDTPLAVEVHLTRGRHPAARYIRVRDDLM
ncbi:DNA ligase [Kitasatospora nipponensis]|uniref:ATP-dependent DNA ligase n=1 Tax=Kitasatospora nipponensis TaxID=258049 RepID=UPI0031CE346A